MNGESAMPHVFIRHVNGSPMITINDVPYPPMTITLTPYKDLGALNSLPLTSGHSIVKPLLPESQEMAKYLDDLREAGLRIFFIEETTDYLRPGTDDKMSGTEQTFADMKLILNHIPEAWLILRVNVSPSRDWVNSHPDEQVTYSDGSHRPLMCSTVSHEPLNGMHSLCSEQWIHDIEPHISEYLDAVEKSPYFNRIIGFMLCAGGTYEWYYPDCPGALVQPNGKYADFSEPFMKVYRQFLKGKYGTDEKLQQAWKEPDASLDSPRIPTPEERQHCYQADYAIWDSLRNWHENNKSKRIHPTNEKDEVNQQSTNGVFLNMNTNAITADFFQAWHWGTAKTILAFARFFKNRYPHLLVGSFYSSFACTSFYGSGNNSEVYPLLESNYIDFLASPSCYDNREPGNLIAQRGINDSFSIRDKLYVNEDDARVAGAHPWMLSQTMGLFDINDTLTAMKREFGRNICDGIYSWWYDMHTGWYKEKEVIQLIKQQQQIAEAMTGVNHEKHHDMALLYDTETLHCVSHYTSVHVLDFYRCTELSRTGIPADFYFHNDVTNPNMPDYKIYMVMNCYRLTTQERNDIVCKAKKNHAVIVWLYAAGYINPDKENCMDVCNISDTVGMNIRENTVLRFPHFRVDVTQAPVAKASARRVYGGIDRPIRSSVWIQRDQVQPWALLPSFYIDDAEAIVLARYRDNGDPIMAMKSFTDYTSVYCAATVLRNDLLGSICEWAGCHRYIDTDDGLYANENFVVLHATHDGKVHVRLKKECSPYEVYEQKYQAGKVKEFDVDVQIGDTKMWCVDDDLTAILMKMNSAEN